jgi:hypothetical protein
MQPIEMAYQCEFAILGVGSRCSEMRDLSIKNKRKNIRVVLNK